MKVSKLRSHKIPSDRVSGRGNVSKFGASKDGFRSKVENWSWSKEREGYGVRDKRTRKESDLAGVSSEE